MATGQLHPLGYYWSAQNLPSAALPYARKRSLLPPSRSLRGLVVVHGAGQGADRHDDRSSVVHYRGRGGVNKKGAGILGDGRPFQPLIQVTGREDTACGIGVGGAIGDPVVLLLSQ
jgi:hypothetical protein